MKISDIIEAYIREIFEEEEYIELRRGELATKFNCVPSQINYVIGTRFVPELGFYVESRRGGGGYIRISRTSMSSEVDISNIMQKIGRNLSQNVGDIYLQHLIRYNIVDDKIANLISAAMSDKSLSKVESGNRDLVRADIFKNILLNLK